MIKVKTSEIKKELENTGIKYSQYNARIKWVADRLEIKPICKIKKEWAYTKTDASKIIKWISRGYNGKRGKKLGQKNKVKDVAIKPSYSTRKIELLEDEIKDLEWSIKNYKGDIEVLNGRISFLENLNSILRQENELLKQAKKEEKRRKFWFFK